MLLDKGQSIFCCSSDGEDDKDASKGGVVTGHAYSLIRIEAQVGKARVDMLQVRNPHGAQGKEWNGRWSDQDKSWKKHPDVKAALKPEDKEDGAPKPPECPG
jgi:hypothetical protein